MHKYRQPSRTSLFLIELMISIFFLAITSVVCIRLYLYAHQLSDHSTRETQAVQRAQSAAESFISARGDLQKALVLLLQTRDSPDQASLSSQLTDAARAAGSSIRLFYDQDWNLLTIDMEGEKEDNKGSAAYCMTLTPQTGSRNSAGGEQKILNITIENVSSSDGIIYSTSVEQYIPGREQTHG